MTQTEPYSDDDLIPIRYLNDLFFCERRAALHLNEQLWKHNQFTVEGIHSHQRVDRPHKETRPDCTTAFSLWLVSRRLGLVGKADVVEFHPLAEDHAASDDGAAEPLGQYVPRQSLGTRSRGLVPFPIDYKRGRKRRWDRDDVQLCAQALCLEEMLAVTVPRGAIFHVKSRQRRDVSFDATLRTKTEQAIARLRELVTSQVTPLAKYEKKCDGCSLKDLCMPKSLRPRATAARYLLQVIAQPDDTASATEPLP
ncbi:MAG: CRISPR-associated protein Cas4 [Candidatus Paceibacterota bacterium]